MTHGTCGICANVVDPCCSLIFLDPYIKYLASPLAVLVGYVNIIVQTNLIEQDTRLLSYYSQLLVRGGYSSYDDCLEDKREDYQNCFVPYSVGLPQLYPIMHTQSLIYRVRQNKVAP